MDTSLVFPQEGLVLTINKVDLVQGNQHGRQVASHVYKNDMLSFLGL